jgi:hypothetical protein
MTVETESTGTGTISAEQAAIEERLVRIVISSFDDCADARLKFVMQALVQHLHNFIREVRLSEAEWNRAIAFLTDAGHITDDKREEFVLLSDVLGASMQTVAVNNTAYKNATEATVFGPFFAEGAPLHRAGRRHVGRGGRAAEGAGNGDRHRWHPAARCSYRGVAGRREGFLRRPIRRQSGSRARPPLRRREWWSLILGAHAHPATRSPMMGRSARCSPRSAVPRCERPICTSWSPPKTKAPIGSHSRSCQGADNPRVTTRRPIRDHVSYLDLLARPPAAATAHLPHSEPCRASLWRRQTAASSSGRTAARSRFRRTPGASNA